MSSWKKVKGLFWQSGEAGGGHDPAPEGELSDAEFADLLATSPYAVPPAEAAPPAVPAAYPPVILAGGSQIDFQALYDAAGIPNTDEVEQLENFLGRLDSSLPQASKLAAAQAFLGAVGKSHDHVLEDAGRKIQQVRATLSAKQTETQAAWAAEQQHVEALQAQIEAHRQRMEALTHELEAVRQACSTEESRLQAARVFFGNVR